MENTYVAIMAGGVGSRFWPGSRESRPKQFLDMLGVGKSLLRLTFERFLPLVPAENFLVVTNARYKDLVKQHLPELKDSQILCEPSRNNTAPCIAYTAFKLADLNPDANIVITPADHIVLKPDIFIEKIKAARAFAASHDALVTLGVQPSRPDTGFGYIQFGAMADEQVRKVLRFTEKPDLHTAQSFLESGDYLWNAGIFVWSVASVLKAFEVHTPEIFRLFQKGQTLYNTPGEQAFIDREYPNAPNISVDFAIMEKANNVFTVPADFGWSDLGTWASLHAECPQDEHNNVLQGEVVALNTTGCMVRAPEGKLVVIKDMHDYILVDDNDVLIILPIHKEQEIKQITEIVKARYPGRYL